MALAHRSGPTDRSLTDMTRSRQLGFCGLFAQLRAEKLIPYS
jgi:hypothetical protein